MGWGGGVEEGGGARFLRGGKIWECEGVTRSYVSRGKDRTASREDGGDGGRRV